MADFSSALAMHFAPTRGRRRKAIHVDYPTWVEWALEGQKPTRCRTKRAVGVRDAVAIRPTAIVFYADGDAYASPVTIKLCLDPKSGAPSQSAAEAEYDALNRGLELQQCTDLRFTPRPRELFAELGVVVREWLPGPSLTEHICNSSLAETRRALRETASCLAHVHRSTRSADRPMHVAGMVTYLDRQMSETGLASLPRKVQSAIALLRDAAASVAEESVPWCRVVGDFKPDNLIVSGGTILDIDFTLSFDGGIIEDLAQFLNHLAMLCYSPRGLRHLRNKNLLLDTFCDAYMESFGADIPQKPLTWRRLQNAVRHILNRPPWYASPLSAVETWFLEKTIAQLSNELRSW